MSGPSTLSGAPRAGPALWAAVVLAAACGGEAPTTPTTPDPPEPEAPPDPAEVVAEHLTIDLNALPAYADPDWPVHYDILALARRNDEPDNPVTDAGATLGRVLFYDEELSLDRSLSCASCHQQGLGFTDSRRLSVGLAGDSTAAHSMRLANARFFEGREMFWDRRAPTVEAQVLEPVLDATELGFSASAGGLDALIARLEELAYYPPLFQRAFGTPEITEGRLRRALAQYVRSIVSVGSRFDEGFAEAFPTVPRGGVREIPGFTEVETRGFQLFALAPGQDQGGFACATCHQIPSFALDRASRSNGLDPGESTVFKAPSLKNVAVSGPYMHDGRFATLDEVLDHYSAGIEDGPALDDRLRGPDGEPLRMSFTDEERAALLAFMETLTDSALLVDERFSDPFRP